MHYTAHTKFVYLKNKFYVDTVVYVVYTHLCQERKGTLILT